MGRELADKLLSAQTNFTRTRKEVRAAVDLQKFPLSSEPALVHPHTTSVVKMRDTGAIDIFVGTDNGIRIDPNTRTINLLGNEVRQKTSQENKKIDRNSTAEIGGNWTVNVSGDLSFATNGSMTFAARKDIHISTSEGSIQILEKGRERFESIRNS